MAKGRLKTLGVEPPYTEDELEGFRRYHDMSFVIWDKNTNAVHQAEDLDASFDGSNIVFSLPKNKDLMKEAKPKREISGPYTDEELEALKRFHEGWFLIWNPNTQTLHQTAAMHVGFNGPNVSFTIHKTRKKAKHFTMI